MPDKHTKLHISDDQVRFVFLKVRRHHQNKITLQSRHMKPGPMHKKALRHHIVKHDLHSGEHSRVIKSDSLTKVDDGGLQLISMTFAGRKR